MLILNGNTVEKPVVSENKVWFPEEYEPASLKLICGAKFAKGSDNVFLIVPPVVRFDASGEPMENWNFVESP